MGRPSVLLPLIHLLFDVHRALGHAHAHRVLGDVDQARRQPGVRAENVYTRYVEALAGHGTVLFHA